MASDPGALTPKGETKRRLRRGARRAHLDIAPALPNEPAVEETQDAREPESAQAVAKPKAKAKAKAK